MQTTIIYEYVRTKNESDHCEDSFLFQVNANGEEKDYVFFKYRTLNSNEKKTIVSKKTFGFITLGLFIPILFSQGSILIGLLFTGLLIIGLLNLVNDLVNREETRSKQEQNRIKREKEKEEEKRIFLQGNGFFIKRRKMLMQIINELEGKGYIANAKYLSLFLDEKINKLILKTQARSQ
ncbi:MAG: hypothetical protein JZU65_24485 [Chlorobium sp.]|nr:hypothetical protein [Chlorobium sp.]